MRRLLVIVGVWIAALGAVIAVSARSARAGGTGTNAVTTAGYGNLRDNWDSDEPELSPADVQSSSFGKLFKTQLKGAIYAQPLVFGGRVIVTTEQANAYGVNASTGAIEWTRSFGHPFKAATIGCSDLEPYIGSTSTPVIEPASGTVYLTTRLQTGSGLANSHWWLQAISATTGEEKPGFPVEIAGTPANTPGVPFNQNYQMQRPGLLLLNGVIYLGFASDCDITPYRGIVVGINATSGAMTTMWSDESGVGAGENSMAGIWQGGGGLVSNEPGHIILTSGNGVSPSPAPSSKPPATLSESVIGLTVGEHGELTPSQFFAPSNAPTLDQNDEDLGSGGPIALPPEYFGTKAHPNLVVQVGKDGRIFLVDAHNMGGYRQGAGEGDAVLQTLGPFDGVWGHPAAYGGQGGWVYVLESAGGGFLRALSYGLNGEGLPALTSVATSAESFGYTSGSPLVTSDGTSAGSGVVWVVYSNGPEGAKGQLRAYSATPSGATLPLLWSHAIGTVPKFAVPTAAEGRVYVGSRGGVLYAFGATAAAPVQAPSVALGSVPVGGEHTATVPVSASRGVTISGPVTSSGEQGASGAGRREPEAEEEAEEAPETEAGAGGASAGAARATSRDRLGVARARAALTAGPTRIPPSGNGPLASGVVTVQQPPIGAAIAAGGTLRLHVRFKPKHAGPVVGVLLIHTSAGTRAVTFSGYGTAPGLVLSAPPLDFRTIETGAGGKALSLTLTNSWTRPEKLSAVQLPRGPFHISGLPRVGTMLAPRRAVSISVLFDPTRAGGYRTRLGIVVDGRATVVPVSATAVAGHARLSVSPGGINAGSVPVGGSRTLTFTLANTGNVPLTISRAIAPLGEFSPLVAVPEGITLDAGTKVHVRVVFHPTRAGTASGEYRFNSNAGGGYVSVHLRGTGS